MYKYMLILFFAFGLAFTTDTVYDNNWALVVGINIYQNAPDLSYAVEDALAIKNMLINEHVQHYSYKLDSTQWSGWSADTTVTLNNLNNGLHIFYVKSRYGPDFVDVSPASVTFTVDYDTP